MKRRIISISVLFVAGILTAQTSLSSTENYIYSKTYLSDPSFPGTAKTSETVQYFDGLGRPNQIIGIKASPTGRDMVTTIPYDQFGRQVDSWLPVPMPTTNGAVQQGVSSAAQSFYGDNISFSHKELEASPLDRVLSLAQPGTAWQGHSIGYEYDINDAQDVKKYIATFDYSNAQSSLSFAGMYEVSKLYKNTITDEDGNQTIEFKNGEGQVVLVRKMLTATEKADTYYVYNEYNQLAFVIPPLASKIQTLSLSDTNNLCYQYKYDGRNRLVEKKLPGKGWEYMVYDKQDRLVMTQDANMGITKQWLFTKYDQFGRIAYTGLYTSIQNYGSAGRAAEQVNVDSKGSNNVMRTTAIGINSSGVDVYYDNAASSSYPNTITKLLSINYYDTYPTYNFNPAFPTTILGETTMTDTPTTEGLNTKSLAVMSLVKNIEEDNWTKNYTYYDKKGRAIGSYSINHLGGRTKVESKLDFAGVVQQSITTHKRLNTDTDKVITENFTYDQQNRLLTHTHQIGSATAEILAQNTYNELSQLSGKKVGGTSPSTSLQDISYSYNIRGWMTKINDPANLNGRLFGYEIKYNNPENSSAVPARFNGNIAEIDWMTGTVPNGIKRRYSYQYDGLNRLLRGTYLQPESSVTGRDYYSELLSYDINGNISTLKRFSAPGSGTTAEKKDDLVYNYAGNRVVKITDGSGNISGYPGGGNTIAYDSNGNMVDMIDKKIKAIGYNFLNLPKSIQITPATGKQINITYVYRADGIKLSKNFTQDTNIITTDYLDGFQYQHSALQPTVTDLKFVPTSEGYYNFENNKYIYNYVDHLGNVRLSYFNNGSNTEVLEENNYYPFGLKHEGYNALAGNLSYQYKYNGKELQTESGMYDYGARFYMPDIGRWGVVDPLAETSRRWSPYTYAFNNPLRFIDPDGRQNEDIIHVNAQGYVTQIEIQEGPHIVVDESGNQLNTNDSKSDQEQLDAVASYGRTMSDYELQDAEIRLFTTYSAQDMANAFNRIGIEEIKSNVEYRKSIVGTGSLSYFTYGAILGHSEFDFAGEMGSLVRNGGNYPKLQGPTDTPVDGTGGFVRFEGSNTLYNVYDAGNFMTGKAFQMTEYSLDMVKTGADISSRITLNGPDTATDQKAITAGYNYNRVGWKK